ncbi:TPA: hypothetical protein DCZ31_01015 [Patescibacteria group bacterium]|nr:hypothetical protein [Candidatus Gracilibacteria bacterium]
MLQYRYQIYLNNFLKFLENLGYLSFTAQLVEPSLEPLFLELQFYYLGYELSLYKLLVLQYLELLELRPFLN